MNIYFTASVRGGRSLQPAYAEIVEVLKKYGEVSGQQVADEELSELGEIEYSEKELYEREIKSMQNCDVVVAELTMPSLGVGYLIGQAACFNKRIICLYQGKNLDKLSAMIKGNQAIEIILYDDPEEIEKPIAKYLK